MNMLFIAILFTSLSISKVLTLEVIYALNAGGDAFTDSHGIRYRRDFLTEGVPSDYGKMLDIKRVHPQDKVLYQTERYATETFGYTIPMSAGDAEYVLWLKFCEVWFNAARLKVFDVALNNVIVVKDIDIFDKVGRGVAHDEIIPFVVKSNKLIINGKTIPYNNEVRVDFIKTDLDNPKVNAIIILKGKPDQVPQLQPYKKESPLDEFEDDSEDTDEKFNNDEPSSRNDRHDDDEDEEVQHESEYVKNKRKNKQEPPKIVDPYASDETSYLLPILVTIGAFIPLLYCLCRL